MNEKLEFFKKNIYHKSISVVGIGISNTPLIEMLVKMGAYVTARDKNSAEKIGKTIDKLERLGVKLILGDTYLDDLDEEIIFKTPGMRYDTPQLLAAKERGAIITSEMEVFFDLCPAKIIAVTGSDGKTTTTTLIYKMIEKSSVKCFLGGNIGAPILPRIEEIEEDAIVVLELSSFQLHTMRKSPNIAVITNLSPNHLDMHKSMEEYVEAKINIFKFQTNHDEFITNLDNTITKDINVGTNTLFFSRVSDVHNGAYLKNDAIYLCENKVERKILDISDIKLPGVHNIENYMAAILAVRNIATEEAIKEVAKTFGGVEHRIELVRELNGVKYYNSSIDSSPNRTKNTLNVFNQKVILISGGKDKGIPYDEIGPVIAEKVKKLILIGATSDKIYQALEKTGAKVDTVICTTYNEVVKEAYDSAKKGDIVVLSPASTSFDMFKNFEERGNLFKKLVMEL